MISEGNPAAGLRLVETGAVSTEVDAAIGSDLSARTAAGRSLAEQFASIAAMRGHAPAFTTATSRWSYTRLLEAAWGVAGAIAAQRSFTPGGRIILLLPNSAEYAASFYGVLLAGGVVVPLSPRTERGALAAIIASTDAPLILTTTAVAAVRADLKDRPVQIVSGADGTPSEPLSRSPAGPAPGGLAAILFTAGSSGTPKGVMLSHENLLANARSIREYLAITPDDRPLCVLPFHHAFGNSVLQSHLLAGAHLIVDGQALFPETLIEALARNACTSLSGVPDLFRVLLERTSLGRCALPRLRAMAVAGGQLPREIALEVARRIAPARMFVMYGQTEATARLAFIPPERLAELPDGAIGRAIPGTTLEVVSARDIAVSAGEVGELRAKGPGVMLGFWRDPAATAERLRNGWLYTGDLATTDAAGSIVLKGRKSAFVKISGYRIHPNDLEEFAARRLSATQAVAVVFESPQAGPRLALFLRIGPGQGGLTASQAIARCRAELPGYLVPDVLQFVDEFPLNEALKIDRPRLAHLAEQEAAGRRTPA